MTHSQVMIRPSSIQTSGRLSITCILSVTNKMDSVKNLVRTTHGFPESAKQGGIIHFPWDVCGALNATLGTESTDNNDWKSRLQKTYYR